MGCFGASDAHVVNKIGTYATKFSHNIRDEKDFIEAIKQGNFCPVRKKEQGFETINVYDTLKTT
ncbi:PHP-associated domain-containing protein [Clostridium putrefaciens]|uniref:PHP-associated domain-containing protein n=1 Tax=Clostridium putrefaciens TaxID=99675 RepID=UPI00241D3EA2|nr:PHP-associated domain-containing protein [Clostridium putrefaciens]